MEVTRTSQVTVTMSEQEAWDIAYVISEALSLANEPRADGTPANWRSDDRVLKNLHNRIKPADWGDLA